MTKIMGTYQLEDLLAQDFTPASDFGLDAIAQAIQARNAFLNKSVNEQLALVAETSADVRRVWQGSENMEMMEVDEIGVARPQKGVSGVEVDFPLRKFSVTTGWTADYLAHATPADLAKKAMDIQNAYLKRMQDEVKFALFSSGNYTFKDFLGDNTDLSVKAFLNNDSSVIPDAPDGTSFAGTHQHYNGTSGASLAYGDIDTLISNVEEHGAGGLGIALFINSSNVTTLSGLASTKFTALTLSALAVPGRTSGTVVTADVDDDPANKLVGYWNGYPVHTRSWVPANYYAAIALGAAQKPLVHRVDAFAGLRGLRMVPLYGLHPMTAQTWEAEVGFGAWNRAGAAFLYGSAQTTYTDPTLVR